jgi:2,3-bisphosphoglycerate-independent phosphoglycerate mutase
LVKRTVKYLLVIYEGAADTASNELEGATPLQLARNVRATELAVRGMSGWLDWTEGEPVTRAEQALAIVLGVPPAEAKILHRGSVEAAATAIDPSRWTYAYRGNFVTMDGPVIREDRVNNLSLDETKWLADAIGEAKDNPRVHLEVVGEGRLSVLFSRLDGDIDPGAFPEVGTRAGLGNDDNDPVRFSDRDVFMRQAAAILARQPLNDIRLDLGENPAGMIWLWGGGPPVTISRPFMGAPLKAAMVTQSPMARGMAVLCGMKTFPLGDLWAEAVKPGIMSARQFDEVVRAHELTVIYVEAPWEQGRYGSALEKVKALDRIDIHVLGRVADLMSRQPDLRVQVVALAEEGLPQRRSPIMVAGAGAVRDAVTRWDEMAGAEGGIGPLAAPRCLTRLLGD